MEINVIFSCCSTYLGETENGVHQVPDGCTIEEALCAFEKTYCREFPGDLGKYLGFMINGKSAQISNSLSAGDTLIILRKIYGG